MEIKENIVISGLSGRYPECNNVQEFKEALLRGVDMVTEDDGRFQTGIMNICKRVGKLPQAEKFDAVFFGIHPKQANFMDPRQRKILESVYECIIDAGFNPQELRGSRTGVYAANTTFNNLQGMMEYNTGGYTATGVSLALTANRVSYHFDFKGPSYVVDSACASSMIALINAVKDIRSGVIDNAIVCGANMIFHPFETLEFKKINMMSDDGKCKAFSTHKNGYARAESVTSILLQRGNESRRIYATVLGAGVNIDGYKEKGITYPSSKMQYELLRTVYKESGINPNDISYLEAHGTGTPAGDSEECESIVNMFCANRKDPLSIGAVKSNMGHCEIASALAAITKVLIAMESGVIPANLYAEPLDMKLPGIKDGKIKVVTENLSWSGGLVGINCSGFGGTNTHLILKSNPKEKADKFRRTKSRLVHVSGRTKEAVHHFLDEIEKNQNDEELLALVDEVHKMNVEGHNFRGYVVLGAKSRREVGKYSQKRPIWFIYTGMGAQWIKMGQDLLKIDIFRTTIERCASALEPYNIDLLNVLTNTSPTIFDDIVNSFCAITAVEIALTDTLYMLGIVPDGIAGYSLGEVGCSYADGQMTPEEAILVAYARGYATKNIRPPPGQMAAVGLSKEDCQELLPEDVFIACHNGTKSVTVSGPKDSVSNFVEKLGQQGIFAKNVDCGGIAYHSKYIEDAAPILFNFLKNLLTTPKPRSSKWISTSIPDHKIDEYWTKYVCAEYHTNNFCSQVLFHQIYQCIPEDAIVIEVGPHGLMQGILKRELGPNTTNIPLTHRFSEDNEEFFLSSIGKIYIAGGVPNLRKLYDNVSFPVSRGTTMLSPMVKWDHRADWLTPYWKKKNYLGETVTVNLSDKSYKFLEGYNIDGTVLMPATDYLELVWKVFCTTFMKETMSLPVVIENIKFRKFTVLPLNEDVKFQINIMKHSGYFEIYEGETVVVTGIIRSPKDITNEYFNPDRIKVSNGNYLPLKEEDFYKECRLRRYMYKDYFRGIIECDVDGCEGRIEWKESFTSFLDSMVQLTLLKITTRELLLPSYIEKLIINPVDHLNKAKKTEFDVYCNQHLNIVKSGGIEMIGLEFSGIPSRQVQEDLVLETFQFVPYIFSGNTNLEDAVYVALQIIFQNCNSFMTRSSICELPRNDSVTVDCIRKILERQVIADPIYVPYSEDKGNNECDFVITTDKTMDQYTVKNILKHLKPDGFILYVGDIFKTQNDNLQIVFKASCDERDVCILRPNYSFPDSYTTVNIRNSDFDWLETVKDIVQHKKYKVAYLYSQGDEVSGIVGFTKCLMAELNETTFRSILVLDKNEKKFSVDDEFYRCQLLRNLSFNVLKNGQWGTFVHRPLKDLEYREVKNASITASIPGDVSSLTWVEKPSAYIKSDPESQFVYIFYSSLNFTDVSTTTEELKQQQVSEILTPELNIVTEYAGITDDGERMMGLLTHEELSLQILSDPVFSWLVPRSWSLEDAATVPYAYAMCYYAMLIKGQMQSGESILVHAGSGGIGLAAISIALSMGCTVFTAVEGEEERIFIRKMYPTLEDKSIGNPRSTSFRKMILQNTNGKGVDLVLNSLSGDCFQESLKCISKWGRFLEIGEATSLNETTIDLKRFFKNCSVYRISLEDLNEGCSEEKQRIKYLLEEGIKSGVVRPLPRKTFAETEVESAFRYVLSGKRERKVLIQIRKEDPIVIHSPIRSIIALPRLYFDPKKSYIVIGGLGGLGLELTDWMIKKGATKIILNSRRSITNGYQSLCFKKWSQLRGVIVNINNEDTTSLQVSHDLVMAAESLGPVGGVFHTAVVLQDALIENQTKEMYEKVFQSKIVSAQNMDTATRTSCPQLDHFVLCSSLTGGRGNFGQTNYGMANSALDMLCLKRKEENLPGLAVQWGPLADVGVWVKMKDDSRNLDKVFKCLLSQNILSCLNALEKFILQSTAVGSSAVLAKKHSTANAQLVETPAETVAHIMQFQNMDMVDKNATLTRLGLDSVMFGEVKQALYTSFQLKLSAAEIQNLTFNKLMNMENIKHEIPSVTS